MHPACLDVHPSWVDLPGSPDTSAAWRWFHLRSWIHADAYEALLHHCARADALGAAQVLDVLSLAAEAMTRSGAGARRCTPSDVQWARRTGLALFGAAIRRTDARHREDSEGAVRLLLPYLANGEREVARLALPRMLASDGRLTSSDASSLEGVASIAKINRLLDLCRARVQATSPGEHSS